MFTPKKEAWWIISEDNKYFPSYYPYGLTQYVYEILFFPIHIILWSIILFLYPSYKIEVFIGFIFGLFINILFSFINDYNFSIKIDQDKHIVVSQSLNLLNGDLVIPKNNVYNLDNLNVSCKKRCFN